MEIFFGYGSSTVTLSHDCLGTCEHSIHKVTLNAQIEDTRIVFSFDLDNGIDCIDVLLQNLILMNDLKTNSIEYKTIESDFFLSIEMGVKGDLKYSFHLQSFNVLNDVNLGFTISSDQTELPRLIKEITLFSHYLTSKH